MQARRSLPAAVAARAISRSGTMKDAAAADLILLAVPVLAIMDWMGQLAPLLGPHQLVADVGSTKLVLCEFAAGRYNGEGQARFLPGHPMAGKESGGAGLAEATLFDGAMWLVYAGCRRDRSGGGVACVGLQSLAAVPWIWMRRGTTRSARG